MSERISRRRFLAQGGAAVLAQSGATILGLSAFPRPAQAQRELSSEPARAALPAVLCLYSPEGAQTAGETLMTGASALDAAEQGMRAVENVLPPKGYNVGLSAVLNARGEAELDASIMDGRTHRSGSVGALQGIDHPISVARQVMEKTPHALLVGAGAQEFARQMGFEVKDIVSAERKQQYQDWLKAEALRKRLRDRIAADPAAAARAFRQFIAQPKGQLTGDQRGFVLLEAFTDSFGVGYAQPLVKVLSPSELKRVQDARVRGVMNWFALEVEMLSDYEAILGGGSSGNESRPGASVPEPHETSGLITLTASGDMAVAVSTGGLFGKLPGRLGDSPIIGAGGYVDNDAGAACAVGVGEQMIRTVGSHMVVENLRAGMSPEEACQDALGRMIAKGHTKYVCVAALRKDGAYAAAHLGVPADTTVYHIFSAGQLQKLESVGVRPLPSETAVEVALLKEGRFEIVISDAVGRRVRTIADRRKAGYHRLEWDGRDDAGVRLRPGVYFCEVRTGDHTSPRQRLLLRPSEEEIHQAVLL